jgi:hypothetical protein
MSLRNYARLAAVYGTGVGGAGLAFRLTGRRLPRSIDPWDVALLGTATFKLSRLLTKDKVTSFLRSPVARFDSPGAGPEVNDAPRGEGIQRAVGELVTCPFCTGQWVGTALLGLYLFNRPLGRTVAGLFSSLTLADWLHYAETALHNALE